MSSTKGPCPPKQGFPSSQSGYPTRCLVQSGALFLSFTHHMMQIYSGCRLTSKLTDPYTPPPRATSPSAKPGLHHVEHNIHPDPCLFYCRSLFTHLCQSASYLTLDILIIMDYLDLSRLPGLSKLAVRLQRQRHIPGVSPSLSLVTRLEIVDCIVPVCFNIGHFRCGSCK